MDKKVIKVYCNNCCGERHHEVLHREVITWDELVDDRYPIDGGNAYDLVKCCGCDNVALRHQSWFSEETDIEGKPLIKTVLYPPETYRSKPKWLMDLFWAMPIANNFIGEFINEIYIALRNHSLRLAVMGIRALLEQIMIDKVGDHGSFKENLDAFELKGFVSKSQRTILEPVLEAGHATMHRAFRPTKSDIGNLMDITENIIESIYINEHRALDISKRVPSRPKKDCKNSS